MSWQSPPFNPSRAKLWKGGFSRIFGCVSDGVTDTFGLRQWCDAYIVLYDSVVMDPQHYSILYPRLILNLIPPEGTWIEIIGVGVVSDVTTEPTRWLRNTWDDIRAVTDHISMGTSNRFVWDHMPGVEMETSSGVAYHAGKDRSYTMPQDAGTVYELEPVTRSAVEFPTPHLDLYDHSKFAGAFMRPNGKIYGVPDAAAYIPEFDPVTGDSRMIPIKDFHGEAVWTDRMFQCGVVQGDTAIGVPFDAKYFLVVDLITGETSQQTLGLPEDVLAVPGKWDGIAYDKEGNAYCAPYNVDSVLKITPDLVVTLIPIPAHDMDPLMASKFRGACYSSFDDRVYFAPFNAAGILALYVQSGLFDYVELPEMACKRFRFWGCAPRGNDQSHIVFAPHDARLILDYDISNDVVAELDVSLHDNMLKDIIDREFCFCGAWHDPFGKAHLCAYQAPCDIVVDEDGSLRAWKQESRKTFHHGGGDRPTQIAGAHDGGGVAMYLPWRNNSITPWTVNATRYSLDIINSCTALLNPLSITSNWDEEKQKYYLSDPADLVPNNWYHGDKTWREIVGVIDLGDVRFQMQDDGDMARQRVSGLEMWARQQEPIELDVPHKPDDRIASTRAPNGEIAYPFNTRQHYPRWVWGRNKAFYGLEPANDDTEMVALPNSQPFFLFRPKTLLRKDENKSYVYPTGHSRDQWYNGTVMGADGFIWAIPYNAPHIMHFDTDRETARLDRYGLDLRDRRKWYGGVRAGKYVFGIPFDRKAVLVIDTEAELIYETDFGLDLSGSCKFMSGVFRDGKVFMVPCHADYFLVIDVASMTATKETFDIPASVMSQTFKWGTCGINQSDQIICGPLGTYVGSNESSLPGTRPYAWIDPDMTAKYSTSTNQYGYGFASSMYVNGWLIFRPKLSSWNYWGYRPKRMPQEVTATTGTMGYWYRTYVGQNIADHESVYVIDHWVYGLSDTWDWVYSIATEDWSTYNERYDEVPGVRPWIGLAPSALALYDEDEFAEWGAECRKYRKESPWCDPHYVGNNTAYAINCNSGIICRCTVQSYNHFREYLRETNNHEDSYKGAVFLNGKIYPVPSSIPLMDVIDEKTKEIERVYVEPPPNWRGFDMHRAGTAFDGKAVFAPGYQTPYFSYFDPNANTWEHIKVPDELWVVNGWREWTRVDDTLWGIPFHADGFLIWDLATKTATKWAPEEVLQWSDKQWSDGIHWRRDSSHADREVTFLLPYNNEKLAVARMWGKDAPPDIDRDFFDATFPGPKKWSCWASPSDKRPFMFGVPANAQGVLKLDVRGGEPEVSDWGIDLAAGWDQEEKWLSCVNHLINGREFAVFIPYNARDILLVDWNTFKVYKAEYSGASLAGTRKWWGAWEHGDRVFCVPYDAAGFLEIRFTLSVEGDELKFSAVGTLSTYGLSMIGTAKWRGVAWLNIYNSSGGNNNSRPPVDSYMTSIWCAVCIPCNSNRFASIYFNKGLYSNSGYAAGGINSNPISAQLMQIGVPAVYLDNIQDKWAPIPAIAKPSVDLTQTSPDNVEYEFPAWNHEYTMRVAANAQLPQAWIVPHRQPADRRGWVSTRFHNEWPKGAGQTRSWSIPWTCGTFLMHNGSEVDEFDAWFGMERTGKFGPAALDKRRNLIVSPYGGTAPIKINVDTREAEWITSTTNFNGACSGCDFIHASPTGRIYLYPGREFDRGRGPLPHQGDIYVDSRPVIKAGNGFVIDTMVAMQDTFSFWPRWPSFSYSNTDARYRAPAGNGCPPGGGYSVMMPVDFYSTIACGKTGFAFLPAVSGMMTSHRVRRGRAYDRKQLQWSGDRKAADRGQRPPKTMTPVWHNGSLYLFDQIIPLERPLEPYLDPQMYIEIKDDLTSIKPVPFAHGMTASLINRAWPSVVIPVGDWVFFLPSRSSTPTGTSDYIDETPENAKHGRAFNLETKEVTKFEAYWGTWLPRSFPFDGGSYVFAQGAGSVYNTRATLLDDGSAIAGAWNYFGSGFTEEVCRKAGWDSAGKIIYLVSAKAANKNNVLDGWTITVTVTSYSAETGAKSTHSCVFDVVGTHSNTVTIGPAVFLDGFLYVPLESAPHLDQTTLANSFHYIKIKANVDDEAWLMAAPGADSGKRRFGFVVGDGDNASIWLLHDQDGSLTMDMYPPYLDKLNSERRTFTKFSPSFNTAERPFDNSTLIQRTGAGGINQIFAVAPNGKFYFVPVSIVSRAAIVYEMDTENKTFAIRSYHEPKLPRKWNGAVQMADDMVYGMPAGNNRVLAIDFSDADNPVAYQREVLEFHGHARWDTYHDAGIVNSIGDLNGFLHRTDPCDNVARSAVVTKHGHAIAAGYAGIHGQTLEIMRDHSMRMRVPGPSFDSDRKWGHAVLGDDGIIYAAPFDAPEFLSIDPVRMAAGTSTANFSTELHGNGKYMAMVAGVGVAYAMPYNRNDILKLDYTRGELSLLQPANLVGDAKWMESFSEGHEHFLVPYLHSQVGLFHSDIETFEFLNVPDNPLDEDGDRRWRGAVQGGDGVYYAAPFDAPDILSINPKTYEVSRISPMLRLVGENKWLHSVWHEAANTMFLYGGESSSVLALEFDDDGDVWGTYIDPDRARADAPDQYLAARPVIIGTDPSDQKLGIDLFPASGQLQLVADDRFTAFGVNVANYTTVIPTDSNLTYYIPSAAVSQVHYTSSRTATAMNFFNVVPRIPDADKYGRPAIVGRNAYFPPNGSGAWLILNRDTFAVSLEAGVTDDVGELNEFCKIAVPFGPDKVLAPGGDGENYFLEYNIKTKKTTKTGFGHPGSFWEGMDRSADPVVAPDDNIYLWHEQGLVRITPFGAASVIDDYVVESLEDPDSFDYSKVFSYVLPDSIDGSIIRATWFERHSVSSSTLRLRTSMDLDTGEISSSNDQTSWNSAQLDDEGKLWALVSADLYTTGTNPDLDIFCREIHDDGSTTDYRKRLKARHATIGMSGVGTPYFFASRSVGSFYGDNQKMFSGVAGASYFWPRNVGSGGLFDGQGTPTEGYYGACYSRKDGSTVFIPYNGVVFQRIQASGSSQDYTSSIAGAIKPGANSQAFLYAVDMGDEVYILPYRWPTFGIITKSEGETGDSIEYTDFGLNHPYEWRFTHAFVQGKFIVCIPERGFDIVVIDTEFKRAKIVEDPTGVLSIDHGWRGRVRDEFVILNRLKHEAYKVQFDIHSELSEVEPDTTEADDDVVAKCDDEVNAFDIPEGTDLIWVDPEAGAGAGSPDTQYDFLLEFSVRYTLVRGHYGKLAQVSSIAPHKSGRWIYLLSKEKILNAPMGYVIDLEKKTARNIKFTGVRSGGQGVGAACLSGVMTYDAAGDGDDEQGGLAIKTAVYNDLGQVLRGGYFLEIFGVRSPISGINDGVPKGWMIAKDYFDLTNPASGPGNCSFYSRPKFVGYRDPYGKPREAFIAKIDNWGPTYPETPRVISAGLDYATGSLTVDMQGIGFQFDQSEQLTLTPGGAVYLATYKNASVWIDVKSGSLSFAGAAGVTDQWMASAQRGGITYVMPYNGTSMLELEGTKGYVNFLPQAPALRNKYRSCLFISDTEILLIPWSAATPFAVYDISTRKFTAETFGLDPEVFIGAEKFKCAFLRNGGKQCVVFPHRKNVVIVINLETRTAVVLDFLLENMVGGVLQWGDWFERGGKYYGVPYNADYIIRVDVDALTVERVPARLNLSGKAKWAAGAPTPWGDVVFLPYNEGSCLYFSPETHEAYKTGFGTKAAMEHLRPISKVVRWWNNAELLPENSQKPGIDDSDAPPSSVEYDWFACSSDNGASRYDPATGNLLGTPKQWSTYPDLPTDQYLDFVYSPATAKVFGIPHNARDVLVISRGTSDISVQQQRMAPELKAKYAAFFLHGRDCQLCYTSWANYSDGFMASGYTFEYEPMLVASGSGMNIIIDSFTGILKIDHINDVMEWNRPVFTIPGDPPQEYHVSLWENNSSAFSTVVLGPDGCNYLFSPKARWGLVNRGITGSNDKLFMPRKIVTINTRFHVRGPGFEEKPVPVVAAAVTASGRIVTVPGDPVTFSKFNGDSWDTKAWFDLEATSSRWRDLTDARGTTISRVTYWPMFLDTGFNADNKGLVVISPLINNR